MQPISLIEAIYSSLPIVVDNVGSVSEKIYAGKTETLISDDEESVAALEKLSAFIVLRKRRKGLCER